MASIIKVGRSSIEGVKNHQGAVAITVMAFAGFLLWEGNKKANEDHTYTKLTCNLLGGITAISGTFLFSNRCGQYLDGAAQKLGSWVDKLEAVTVSADDAIKLLTRETRKLSVSLRGVTNEGKEVLKACTGAVKTFEGRGSSLVYEIEKYIKKNGLKLADFNVKIGTVKGSLISFFDRCIGNSS